LDINEARKYDKFVLKHLKSEIKNYERVQSLSEKKELFKGVRQILSWRHNNCELCFRYFYINAFTKEEDDEQSWICYECACKSVNATGLTRLILFDGNGLVDYFKKSIKREIETEDDKDERSVWVYPQKDLDKLSWIKDESKTKSLIDFIRENNKDNFIKKKIKEAEEKILLFQNQMDLSPTLAKIKELEGAVFKQSRIVGNYKRHKQKTDDNLKVN